MTYLEWERAEQDRLRALPQPDMCDRAYYDWQEQLARDEDRGVDSAESFLSSAIERADTFPHKLFRHCNAAERVILATHYFPEAWKELQAEGAALQAEFETKDCWMTAWKRHMEEQVEQRQRENWERSLKGDKRILAEQGVI